MKGHWQWRACAKPENHRIVVSHMLRVRKAAETSRHTKTRHAQQHYPTPTAGDTPINPARTCSLGDAAGACSSSSRSPTHCEVISRDRNAGFELAAVSIAATEYTTCTHRTGGTACKNGTADSVSRGETAVGRPTGSGHTAGGKRLMQHENKRRALPKKQDDSRRAPADRCVVSVCVRGGGVKVAGWCAQSVCQ